MSAMKHIRKVQIRVDAKAGSNIADSLDEAALLCIQERCAVVVVHNAIEHEFDYLDLINTKKTSAR